MTLYKDGILYKEMKKLYQNKYQYKVMLVLDAAWIFRGSDLDLTKGRAEYFQEFGHPTQRISQSDRVFSLIDALELIENFTVRVERCYLSLYFTDIQHVEMIKKVVPTLIKEIYEPKVSLIEGIIVSSLPYDYKVSVKVKKKIDYTGFVQWATDNKNVRISNIALNSLNFNITSRPNVYFYINGDKHLTLARMHLGSSISRVEQVINP